MNIRFDLSMNSNRMSAKENKFNFFSFVWFSSGYEHFFLMVEPMTIASILMSAVNAFEKLFKSVSPIVIKYLDKKSGLTIFWCYRSRWMILFSTRHNENNDESLLSRSCLQTLRIFLSYEWVVNVLLGMATKENNNSSTYDYIYQNEWWER